jgi:general stress protein 26
MAAPRPEVIDPATLVERAQQVMREAKFPLLATLDGDQPRLRPVSPIRTEGFTVFIANLRSYGKTAELAANPRCELCYVDSGHCQVRITALAEVVTDGAVIQSLWASNPLLRQYLGTPENPQLLIYRMQPSRVRFMQEWALEYFEVPLSGVTSA